ncbi:uncharacterized protein LOC111709072 isoform X2 [Eurytemora carolleeae]|uniref:uncharacterized protein LOC111709072 isoform X2 n=1 Tax=Eurytemora carolleeae TaxID=1294199 RepID=UPI000C77DD67|nr:uncharacterized protein LOC111709072 isoform X2 [Eurytemora carolleeae]|eukprot:XP_023338428.1 uncharacterized protein LOC111709072 isoform X2 [Eurytemora affinis]
MAKERVASIPSFSKKVVHAKEKKKKRATFCPNSSNKSLPKTRNKSYQWSGVSKSALKKNNDELAKVLNRYKGGFAEKEKEILSLKSEIMALNQENNALRLQMDQSEELNGRKLRELKNNLNSALDNLFSLQDNVSKSISITNSSLRASQASRASSSSSRISAPLSFTSRISGPPLQETGKANGLSNIRFRDASYLVPHNSPPKNLPQNKVSPMVAGHAISRPRIQLARMDMREAYIQATQENVEPVEAEQEQEAIEQEEAPEIMVIMIPPHTHTHTLLAKSFHLFNHQKI